MTKSLHKLKPFLCLFVLWAILIGLTFAFSRDILAYQCMYVDSLFLAPAERFLNFNGYIRDPAYLFLQAMGTTFLPFEIFFSLLILGALLIKLLALQRVTPNPSLLDVLPYIMVLSFLHEGTAVRVALALSIALWAIIWFAKGKRIQAVLLLCVAATFHISVLCFLIVFIFFMLYERLGLWVFIFIAFIGALLTYTPIVKLLILQMGEVTNARYMAYSTGAIYQRQNSSGLFQYFYLFVGGITIVVWKLYLPSSKVWSELKKLALISGFLAVVILQVFSFNVVISSRLADLLLLPLVLVLGETLVQFKKNNQNKLLCALIILLIAYGCARAFLTYRSDPNAAIVCTPLMQFHMNSKINNLHEDSTLTAQ